jgi:hypothetical protein
MLSDKVSGCAGYRHKPPQAAYHPRLIFCQHPGLDQRADLIIDNVQLPAFMAATRSEGIFTE